MKKTIKLSYNAPVVLSFVLACLCITLLGEITNGLSTALCFSVYRGSLADPFTYVRMLGHILGHDGLGHFMNNAMLLLVTGPMLEEKYGSKTLLKVLIVTALVTGLIHCLLWQNVALCGASGVAFAFIILSSFTAFRTGEIPLTAVLVAVIYIGNEIYSGIFLQDNISNLTHILGGIVGGMAGYFLNRDA